jgi:hypothetical protein
MKKVVIAAFLLLTMGCGSRKEKEARINSASGEAEYVIWVYNGFSIIGRVSCPLNEYTKQKEDSLIRLADSIIQVQENVEKFNKSH